MLCHKYDNIKCIYQIVNIALYLLTTAPQSTAPNRLNRRICMSYSTGICWKHSEIFEFSQGCEAIY